MPKSRQRERKCGNVRAVIDTNILVSGLLWRGPPRSVLEFAQSGTLTLVSSEVLLQELSAVLQRPKFAAILQRFNVPASALTEQVARLCELVSPAALPAPVSRDKDDDHVLACAVAGRCDFIVTGDKDLLVLGEHAGVAILSAPDALVRLRA